VLLLQLQVLQIPSCGRPIESPWRLLLLIGSLVVVVVAVVLFFLFLAVFYSQSSYVSCKTTKRERERRHSISERVSIQRVAFHEHQGAGEAERVVTILACCICLLQFLCIVLFVLVRGLPGCLALYACACV